MASTKHKLPAGDIRLGDEFDLAADGGRIYGSLPTVPNELANKAYVDALVAANLPAEAVEATANIVIDGTGALPNIDGYAVQDGDRILLDAQTAGAENGIWVAKALGVAWYRPDDFATGSHAGGKSVWIKQGTIFADTQWVCVTNPPNDVVDTNALDFTQKTVDVVRVTTTDPTVNDDGAHGFKRGDFWLNQTTPTLFQLTDPTAGAAFWMVVANKTSRPVEIVTTEAGLATAITRLNWGGGGVIIVAAPVTLTAPHTWDLTGITIMGQGEQTGRIMFNGQLVTLSNAGCLFDNIALYGTLATSIAQDSQKLFAASEPGGGGNAMRTYLFRDVTFRNCVGDSNTTPVIDLNGLNGGAYDKMIVTKFINCFHTTPNATESAPMAGLKVSFGAGGANGITHAYNFIQGNIAGRSLGRSRWQFNGTGLTELRASTDGSYQLTDTTDLTGDIQNSLEMLQPHFMANGAPAHNIDRNHFGGIVIVTKTDSAATVNLPAAGDLDDVDAGSSFSMVRRSDQIINVVIPAGVTVYSNTITYTSADSPYTMAQPYDFARLTFLGNDSWIAERAIANFTRIASDEATLDRAILDLNQLGGGTIIITSAISLTANKSWDLSNIVFKGEPVGHYFGLPPVRIDFNGFRVTLTGTSADFADVVFNGTLTNPDTAATTVTSGVDQIFNATSMIRLNASAGDRSAHFNAPGTPIVLSGTALNDGTYTIVSASYVGAQTEIIVAEALVDEGPATTGIAQSGSQTLFLGAEGTTGVATRTFQFQRCQFHNCISGQAAGNVIDLSGLNAGTYQKNCTLRFISVNQHTDGQSPGSAIYGMSVFMGTTGGALDVQATYMFVLSCQEGSWAGRSNWVFRKTNLNNNAWLWHDNTAQVVELGNTEQVCTPGYRAMWSINPAGYTYNLGADQSGAVLQVTNPTSGAFSLATVSYHSMRKGAFVDLIKTGAGALTIYSPSTGTLYFNGQTYSAGAGFVINGTNEHLHFQCIADNTWTCVYVNERVYTSAADPTVNDDVGDGMYAGKLWLNTTSADLFQCLDPTAGAAVWRKRQNLAHMQFLVGPASLAPYATVQAAITAASSGDVVYVLPGTYTENLTLKAGVDIRAVVMPEQIGQQLDALPALSTNTLPRIVGHHSYASTPGGVVRFYGLKLEGDGVAANVASSAVCTIGVYRCWVEGSGAQDLFTSAAGMAVQAFECCLEAYGGDHVFHLGGAGNFNDSFLATDCYIETIGTYVFQASGTGQKTLQITNKASDLESTGARKFFLSGQIIYNVGGTNLALRMDNVVWENQGGGQHLTINGTLAGQSWLHRVYDEDATNPYTTPITIAGTNATSWKEKPNANLNDVMYYDGQFWQTGQLTSIGAKIFNGFPYADPLTYVDLTMNAGNLEVSPVGGPYDFWVAGTKYTKSGTDSVAIANDQTLHYVYYDNTGTLQVSTTPWDIRGDNAPVATVYRDGAIYAITNEMHYYDRDRAWHEWAHETIGTRYESGLTGAFTNTTFSIAQGVIDDEDLETDTGGSKTTCALWRRNAGLTAMRVVQAKTVPYLDTVGDGSGTPQYDNAGTPTAVPLNSYFNAYVYATPDQDYPIYALVAQQTHVNLANALSEALPTILLSTAEWKLLYRVTYRNVGGVAVYGQATDFRSVSSGPAAAATSNTHSGLTGRDVANSHPATAISNTPAGNISSTDVQAAINELDSEKASVGDVQTPRQLFHYLADMFAIPNVADWGLNSPAAIINDPSNTALQVGAFDDTTEEGVGAEVYVPSGTTELLVVMEHRAATAPVGTAKNVDWRMRFRGIPDNAVIPAWTTVDMDHESIAVGDTYYHYTTKRFSLATIGMTAGRDYQIEWSRYTTGTDDLPGDWYCHALRIYVNYTRRKSYPADTMQSALSADWAVNANAAIATDSNNAALKCRRHDDTTEEGCGIDSFVPEAVSKMKVYLKSRAETAPGGASKVAVTMSYREIVDGAAVGSWVRKDLNEIDIPANEYWQDDEEELDLASLPTPMNPGSEYQLQFTRKTPTTYAVDTFTAATDLITLEAAEGDVREMFQAGKQFTTSGATNPVNDGTWTVLSVGWTGTQTTITVVETGVIVDEAASPATAARSIDDLSGDWDTLKYAIEYY